MAAYHGLYTKGTRVWIKNPTEVWQCVSVKQDYDKTGKLLLSTEDDQEISLPIKTESSDLPFLRNPDILIGSNDLTSLSYLHEPSVLYNLRVRFLQHNSIYTWCGIVLVAVNPFADLEIYGEETIRTYHSNNALSQLDPHIYAVAEDAYTKLERNIINQSVIVSGESGAGKTVSAKFAMRYFASIAGSDSNIEARVLASNPIMEAIGNAKTIRNDNSSRFGKYIQILFDRKTQAIMGGNMRTYLLEKSRVTYQSEGERNFHIFYQLVDYAKKNRLEHLELADQEFAYLNSTEQIPYDDMGRFVEALEVLGFGDKQKNCIFQVIAAILHGGNVVFEQLDDERCDISQESLPSLKKFCQLLDLNPSATKQWLTSRLLKTGTHEIITKSLSAEMAQYGREALLKFIYEKLFSWIVTLINSSLGPPNALSEYQFIGVLDIYGFEHFEVNSFEQFCINYANEVLQQQFNLHVFKLEQEEYVREGIDWQFITFNDNQSVIDLIESRPIGVLCLLDEECKMPKGSDETWCCKLFNQISKVEQFGEVFKKPKFGYQKSFIIQHFADVVTYSVTGFLEKNRDTIWDEQIDLLKRSPVIECLFLNDSDSGGATGGTNEPSKKGAGGKIKITHQDQSAAQRQKKKAKATVGFQFRESLDALMKILNSTEPHYVRCIKPNDNKAAFEFNNVRAVQQLRACGVLETIRISSIGFPSRWSYQDFANRYRVLRVGHQDKLRATSESTPSQPSQAEQPGRPKPTPRKLIRAGSNPALEIRQTCEDIVKIVYEEHVYAHFKLNPELEKKPSSSSSDAAVKTPASYQLGKTKIFFRPGQVALLERVRSKKLRECAILMQRIVRGWLVRRRFIRIKNSILLLQRYGRAYLARKRFQHLRRTKAATTIQTAWRAYHQQKVYQQIRNSVIAMQTHGRAYLARCRFTAMKQNLAAITIQRYWRGYSARKKYRETRKKIVLAQCCIRRYLAKKELRRLRIEARSVEHVQNLNRGLEKKIIELQQRNDELLQDNRALRLTEEKSVGMRQEVQTLAAEIALMKSREKEHGVATASFRTELEKLQTENAQLQERVESLQKKNSQFEQLMKNAADSRKQMAVDSKTIEEAVRAREQELRKEFERERKILIAEREREMMSKQDILSKYMDLENTESTRRTQSVSSASGLALGADATVAEDEGVSINYRSDFDSNLQQISVMMRCTELEQELSKIQEINQKLRQQIAKTVDTEDRQAGASLLAEQCADLQEELVRYKKERADLKRVILIEDWVTTSGNVTDPKHEADLLATYKSLYTQLGDKIEKQDQVIQKLKNENIYLKMNVQGGNKSLNSLPPNSSLGTIDPASIEPMYLDTNYTGMFKFKKSDIHFIVKFLIYDVGPQNSFKCEANTLSCITYMCIRYIDYINNEEMIQAFMSELITWIRKKAQTAINKNAVESVVYVMSCAFKIATMIKYYSEYEINNDSTKGMKTSSPILKRNGHGDSGGESDNSDDERSRHSPTSSNHDDNEDSDYTQALKNFDLTDYTQILKDLIIWIYTKLVKMFQNRITNLVVPAILEHEEISSSRMQGQKSSSRAGSVGSDCDPPSPTEKELYTLLKELSNIATMFRMHKLDEDFVFQFFRQIYYFIGAVSMNNLLIRKDLCKDNKAIEIIYNLCLLEQFLREHNIPNWDEVKRTLEPITQANKLLITNKTEKHISTIISTAEALTVPQIVKIINMYTPSDEAQISPRFIKDLTTALQNDRKGSARDPEEKALIMKTQKSYPLILPYIDQHQQQSNENSTNELTQNDANSAASTISGLNIKLKEVEIPVLLKGLDRYLEKV